jgi:hypothetical protein
MSNQITKLLLSSFSNTINGLNSALIEHFQLENEFTAPIRGSKNGKVPPKGTIEHNGNSIEFRFHGTGCEFKANGLVLDFDYIFDSTDYKISFGPHEFKKFVQSLRSSTTFLSKEEQVIAASLSTATHTEGLSFKL